MTPPPAAKKPRAAKPKPPAPEPVPAAAAAAPPPPKAAPEAPAGRAEVPKDHAVVADLGGGVVTTRDPKTRDLTTRFPAGMPGREADRLGAAIGDALDEAKRYVQYRDGLVPAGFLAHLVRKRVPGATDEQVAAALVGMRDRDALEGHVLNETTTLTNGTRDIAPLNGGKDEAASTIWDNGRAVHFWVPRGGRTGRDVAREFAGKGEGGKTPAAAGTPARPTVDASAARLAAEYERSKTEPADVAAKTDALLADLEKNHTPDELREIARRVTGKGGANAKQALANLRADLTAVHRHLEGQKV